MLWLRGIPVELIRNGPHVATLYVPGRLPLSITGAVKITIVERLVEAYRKGSPAVLTKVLLDGLKPTSPSQAFREWKEIVDVYIGQKGQRGSWQLVA